MRLISLVKGSVLSITQGNIKFGEVRLRISYLTLTVIQSERALICSDVTNGSSNH